MKILILSENYFPNISGVPVVVRYLAEGLSKIGHHVSIATSLFSNCSDVEIIGGVNVFRFNLRKDHLNRYYGDTQKYKNFVLAFDCDVIIFECLQCATSDLILPYLDRFKAKKILHSHGLSGLRLKPFEKKKDLGHTIANTYHFLYYKWYFNCMLPKVICKFDKVLSLSEVDDTIAYCAKFGLKSDILGNAVEEIFLEPSKPVVQKDIAGLNMPYFLSVAYYNQIKNQIGILREFYQSGIEDHAMVFIGPSENEYYKALLEEYKELEKSMGHRTVLFLTDVNRSLIPDIVGNAKLYIIGSTIEQFSIAIVETMAKGVPFISTNVGNARLLPGGVTLDNRNNMHNEMKALIADEHLYYQLSEKGKDYVLNNCKRDTVIRKLDMIIKTLL